MRRIRKELIKLCLHRMRGDDRGNADAFIVLIYRLKFANKIAELPKYKRESARFFNDCLDTVVELVGQLQGRPGASRIVFGQFSGRSASIVHRRLSKAFGDVINASPSPAGSNAHSGSSQQSSFRPPNNGVGGNSNNSGNNGGFNGNARARSNQWFNRVRNTPRFDPAKDSCFKCGRLGHMSRNCALAKVENPQ